jgi:hypothetical protein
MAEGAVAELKDRHAPARARRRGTGAFHVQLLLSCTALNLKRLVSRGGKAGAGWAAGPIGLIAAGSPQHHAGRRGTGDRSSTRRSPHQPLGVTVWSFCLSVN